MGAKRVELRLPERSAERLDRLVRETEADSVADVIRNAIRLYEWAVMSAQEGKELCLRDVKTGEIRTASVFAPLS